MLDPKEINVRGWNERSASGDVWTVPVDDDTVRRAQRGDWTVVLTPSTPVPRHWFGELRGARVLCLASGGGQQAPLLAAAGAVVTSFDASEAQLEADRQVAERHGLDVTLQRGFMDDLSCFGAERFDLVFHPVSNCFTPEVRPVWRECFRVLKPGGHLLAGFMNPVLFMFDQRAEARGELLVRFPLPYSDLDDLPPKELEASIAEHRSVAYSHTFETQIAGQLDAGFLLCGFYEDIQPGRLLSRYFPAAFASNALKPLGPIR